MERLTQKVESLGDIWLLENGKTKEMVTESNEYKEYFEKLAEYEDLEEQGLLLRLPCKVGDKVYAFCEEFGILEYEVYGIVSFQDKFIFQCSAWSGYCNEDINECLDEIEPDISAFGKTVFLTYEEADQKLKELQKEGA